MRLSKHDVLIGRIYGCRGSGGGVLRRRLSRSLIRSGMGSGIEENIAALLHGDGLRATQQRIV
jgi:hypothetical protein